MSGQTLLLSSKLINLLVLSMQGHAAAAVVNFSENSEPELVVPYLDTLIGKLLLLLQNGKKTVQVGSMLTGQGSTPRVSVRHRHASSVSMTL